MADDADFPAAFEELYPRAFVLARQLLHNDAAAEDIAAEALARAYAKWRSVGDLPWRDGWVLRVVTNLAIDTVRRRVPRPRALVGGGDGSDAVVDRLVLLPALRELPRRQREAVTLRYLGGLTEAEVADSLGVSCGSVKTHLHRGVTALRRRLGPTFQEGTLATG